MAGALLFSSCDTYVGTGAATGATFGSILGSAIGGIADGPRGSDIGTIIGMAGGAAVGATIGNQTQQNHEQRIHDRYERIQQNKERGYNPYSNKDEASNGSYSSGNTEDDTYAFSSTPESNNSDDSGFDSSNSGDDRITFSPSTSTDDYTAAEPTTVIPDVKSHAEEIPAGVSYTPNIEISNPRFVDANKDGYLNRGEDAKVTFEIYNRGSQPIYNVIPSVIERSGNRHIRITPSIIVESIAPGRGIVYTAFVRADRKLNDGNLNFALAVLQGKKSISKVTEFNIRTRK